MTVENLIAERSIEKQLYRLARAMDDRNWEAMSLVFAEQVEADFGTGLVVGRTAVVDFVRSFLESCGTTQHMLGNMLIDIQGDSATSDSYVADIHLGEGSASTLTFRTLGNYTDSWVKNEETWQIVRRIKNNRATLGSMDVFSTPR